MHIIIFCLFVCVCYSSEHEKDIYKKIFQFYSASHLEQKEIRIGLAYQSSIPKKLLSTSTQKNKTPSNQNCNNESTHLRVSSEK